MIFSQKESGFSFIVPSITFKDTLSQFSFALVKRHHGAREEWIYFELRIEIIIFEDIKKLLWLLFKE